MRRKISDTLIISPQDENKPYTPKLEDKDKEILGMKQDVQRIEKYKVPLLSPNS